MIDLTPNIILSKPQLGENIGSCARAMKNFGIEKLRLIEPRDGWPNISAYAISAGADNILDKTKLFKSLIESTKDISLLFATTARKRVIGTKSLNIFEAINKSFDHVVNGGKVGFLFGPEQSGLSNDDVVQADFTISIPLNEILKINGPNYDNVKSGDIWRANFSRVQWEDDLIDGKYSRKKENNKLKREYNWVWTRQGQINMHIPENWGFIYFNDKKELNKKSKDLRTLAVSLGGVAIITSESSYSVFLKSSRE